MPEKFLHFTPFYSYNYDKSLTPPKKEFSLFTVKQYAGDNNNLKIKIRRHVVWIDGLAQNLVSY